MNQQINLKLAEGNILVALERSMKAKRHIVGRQLAISTMLSLFDHSMPCDVEIGLRLEAKMLHERFHFVLDEQRELRSEYVELFGEFDDD